MARQMICPPGAARIAQEARMSPAVLSHGHLFLTGLTGSGPDGAMPADAETQFRAAFAKIAAVLDAGGAGLADVVEMTSYHIGLRDHFETFDGVRCDVFDAPYPAWTAIEAGGLRRPGALVEIRVIAALPG